MFTKHTAGNLNSSGQNSSATAAIDSLEIKGHFSNAILQHQATMTHELCCNTATHRRQKITVCEKGSK